MPTPTAPASEEPDRVEVGSRPAVMMIHGGSWSHGDKATAAYRSVCQFLASEGFVTFNVDYRLAPTDPFPAGLDDVRRALDFVFRPTTMQTYDVDPDRVGVFGGSAGGNLAALLAVEDHESSAYADGSRIRAVVDLSGPTDLTVRSTGAEGGRCLVPAEAVAVPRVRVVPVVPGGRTSVADVPGDAGDRAVLHRALHRRVHPAVGVAALRDDPARPRRPGDVRRCAGVGALDRAARPGDEPAGHGVPARQPGLTLTLTLTPAPSGPADRSPG
ncbi:alpha/beta hydrolase [Curtobacterium sp. MCJR17_043]|nr:alpha/beta hydrolase [Curtobacterium sp. MCJR17_043]WIB36575.1 alpha/beta hydrolase [Curtobacterium sp. MCJR17_043]